MNNKIIDYIVIKRTPPALTREINYQIQNGWQPFGSPFAVQNYICQAMVKYS